MLDGLQNSLADNHQRQLRQQLNRQQHSGQQLQLLIHKRMALYIVHRTLKRDSLAPAHTPLCLTALQGWYGLL